MNHFLPVCCLATAAWSICDLPALAEDARNAGDPRSPISVSASPAPGVEPVLAYSTYLGGKSADSGLRIAVDPAGNAYVLGSTVSEDFPKTFGLPDATGFLPATGAFLTKLNAAGSAVIYSVIVPGVAAGLGLAVDAAGNAYVTGSAGSSFPATTNAWQREPAGGPEDPGDAFVMKIGPQGTNLVYSTYLGGSAMDYGSGIAVDAAGNAYVTGFTLSTNFPTANPMQAANSGYSEVFVAKLSPDGSELLYSTYFGGSNDEFPAGIAVDAAGNVYLAGQTSSTDLPAANAFQSINGGSLDAFVAKLNTNGSGLLYSTYLGGTGADGGTGVAADGAGNAYVTGFTASTDFPTVNPLQPSFGGGGSDSFVVKVNSDGTRLLYSTYLGGDASEYDFGLVGEHPGIPVDFGGIAADAAGNAWVAGATRSPNFPITNAIKAAKVPYSFDGYFAKLNSSGALMHSTYLGGTSYDTMARAVALDVDGNPYLTGHTEASVEPYFPTTPGAFQPERAGPYSFYYLASDAFAAKISESPPGAAHDKFTGAFSLNGYRLTTLGSNVAATKESGEPNHADNAGGKSVWWSWTAPADGNVTLTTEGSDFDTVLAVYTGSSAANLVPVADNDNASIEVMTSRVKFSAVSGATYRIAVDGTDAVSGKITLNLTLGAPGNDDFSNRPPLSGSRADATGSNINATSEPGEPIHSSPLSKSVWWSWTAPADGNATITTANDFQTTLTIYSGSSVSDLTAVASDKPYTNDIKRVTFKAVAGETYHIAVDGFVGTSGNIVLGIFPAQTPSNDDFANRRLLAGSPVVTNVSILDTTREPGDPDLAQLFGILYSQGSTVWWSWMAPTNGSVLITTTGSTNAQGQEADTRLAIFTGSSFANLTPVAGNDDAREGIHTSRLLLTNIVAGTTYHVLADVVNWDTPGNIRLNLSLIKPPEFLPDSVQRLPGAGFQARLKGTIEQSYTIEASANLIDWAPILTDIATDGFIDFTDPGAIDFQRRFYRAREAQ